MTTSDRLREALARNLQTATRARGFDAVVRAEIVAIPLDWATLAPIVEGLVRAVQEELEEDARCKERKHFHRAWVRGFVTACAERGMTGEAALIPLAHLTLLTCYDEGIMLRVFASSLGYGVGQAWADVSGDEAERQVWLEALRRGIREGLRALADEAEALDPELVAPEAALFGAAERGMALGGFLQSFSPWRGKRNA